VHEYSIVQALVEQVEQEARARCALRVDRVSVRIGELAGVEIELLQTAYQTFRERTICEHAPLEIRLVPAQWVCRTCGAAIDRGAVLRCALCDGAATLQQGDEILLDQIDMEVQ
jgi:hydrogenase nickel incorporation protein HypA/HybF